MFGEKMAGKYQYQPLVREPIEEDEPRKDKNGLPYYNPPFTKIKLGLKYSTVYPDFLVFGKKGRFQEADAI